MMSLPPGIPPEVARGLLGCQTTVLLRASSARCSSVQSNRGKVLRRPADTTIAGLGCQMGSDIGFAMRARKRIRMWFFTVQLKVLESSDQRVPVASDMICAAAHICSYAESRNMRSILLLAAVMFFISES